MQLDQELQSSSWDEKSLIPIIAISDPLTCSIRVDLGNMIYKDKVHIANTCSSHVFSWGQMDELMKFLNKDSGPEIDYAKAIWKIK